jgi:hypothetical protein
VADLSEFSTESSAGTAGPVLLRVPAEPTMSRVARLAASGLASLAGCNIDEIEDIKIAVSEVLIALIEHGTGGRIDLQFDNRDDEFVVTGRAAFEEFDLDHPDLRLCRTVLAGVCSHHEIDAHDGTAQITAAVAILH